MEMMLDAILVIDVESTCWYREPPPGQISEIIEIGACLLDLASLEPRDKRTILVKPVRSTVSSFCTRLTSLTQDQVDSGVSYAKATHILKSELHSKSRIWASDSTYDLKMFQSSSQEFGVPYPFGFTHIDSRALHLAVLGLASDMSLDEQIASLGLAFEGTLHRAADDAWNVARVLGSLLSGSRSALPA